MPDRRLHVRTPTSLHAELRFRTTRDVYGCTVLDRSDGGVQIDLEEDHYLPEELTIRFSDGASQLVRRCWSLGTRSGFEFIEAVPPLSISIDTAGEIMRAFTSGEVGITPATLGHRGERMDMLCSSDMIRGLFAARPELSELKAEGAVRTGAEMMRMLGSGPLYRQEGGSQSTLMPEGPANFLGPKWRKFIPD